jgi:hypothetical protein
LFSRHLPPPGSREWKVDRIGSSIKFGNGRDRIEGVDEVDNDSIDRKNDRKGVKAMKTKESG